MASRVRTRLTLDEMSGKFDDDLRLSDCESREKMSMLNLEC